MTGTAPGTVESGAVNQWGRRDRVVFAALALSRPAPVSQDQLAEALWPEGPPASSAKLVQGCVSRLRAQLGSDTITTLGAGYVLSRHIVTDVDRFEQGVLRGRDLLGLCQADRAAFILADRLQAWTGEPYAELCQWPPAAAESARLLELRLQAQELLVDALLGSGDLRRAAVEAQSFAHDEPLRERRWAQLALAEYGLGQQAAALEALRLCRAHLDRELGIDPGHAITELEVAILRQDRALVPPLVTPHDEECPWPGLSPYGPENAESFFGRDDDIVSALAVLDARGCLAVVGPSGIGKSSFLLAGVVATLRSRGRSVQLVTPRLPRLEHGAEVIVIDQAEELFALPGPELQGLLADLDAYPGGRVIALRADQLSEVTAHPALARLVEQGLFLLGGMSAGALAAAIEQPAAQHGLVVEPGLVDLLLRDLGGEPAALPLFSHALAETWARRQGRTLTVSAYRETGGVRAAVARTAEDVYAATPVGDRSALRSLMLRLVSPSSVGEPRRTRIPTDDVTDSGYVGLVEALVRARLVTRDADTFTLTHEALVDGWPRLREWLDEDVEGRRVFHHLAAAARAWDELGRPDSDLYRGVRLRRALDWAEAADVVLSETESAFLDAGRRQADAEAQALTVQVRRQRRANRTLRVLLVGLVLLLVAAVVAGTLAGVQARRADRHSLEAVASAVGAKALTTDDPQLSLLLAAAAERVSPTTDTSRSLASALAARPLLTRVGQVPDGVHLGAVASSRGLTFAADRRHVVRSFDPDLRPVASYDAGDGHTATIDPPLAVNDAVVVAAGPPGDPRPVRLLDPATLAELPSQLQAAPGNVYVIDLSLSADGRRLAVVYSPATAEHPVVEDVNNRLRVWDLQTGRPAGPPVEVGGRWSGAALSEDGRTVFSSTPVSAYDVATGVRRWTTRVATWNNAIDVRGNLLATSTAEFAGDAPGVNLFDARTGRLRRTLSGDLGSVQEVFLSEDGAKVGATGVSGTAIVWRSRSGQTLQTLDTGGPPITGGAFSADGQRLYLAKPLRQQLQAWDLTGTDGFVRRIGYDAIPAYANAEPLLTRDGSRLAIEGWTDNDLNDLSLTLADLETGRVHHPPVAGTDWLRAAAWNPAGDRYAAGYGDGWVQVIDADTGSEAVRRQVTDRDIVDLSYAGRDRLVGATDDAHLLLLDAGTLEPVGRPATVAGDVADLAGLSDGRTAIVLTEGPERRITWAPEGRTWSRVDLPSGRVEQTGRLTLRQGLTVALAPDERQLAVGGPDGAVEVIDLASGRPVRPALSDGAGDIHHLAFDPAGDRLLAGSHGQPMGLWDATTGTPLAGSGLPEDAPTHAVAFARDGRVLAASTSGNVYAWDVSAAGAVRYACRVAGRDLTRREWSDAFGEMPYRRVCAAA